MIRKVERAVGRLFSSNAPTMQSPPSDPHDPLSVLIVHPSRTRRGGIVNATLAHALGLQLRGHSVEVWTASESLATLLREHAIEVFMHPAISSAIMLNLSSAVRARGRKLRAAGVSAVLHQGAKSYVWSRLNMRRARHAVVFHNRKMGGRRRFRHWFVLSRAHAADLASAPLHGTGKSVHVIHNGYVLDDGANAAMPQDDRLQDGHRRYRIGALCGLFRHKGVDLLLQAAAGPIAAGIPIELRVGGAGPEEAALKSLADDLGISGSVRWLGWIEDRATFFQGIDVFCLPSRSEPFGLAVIEAMATGTPVIASNTDGPAEILAHNSTGWLFPVDDHEALGDTIRRIFDDPENRARIAERAMVEVERRFSPAAAAGTIEKALRDL